MRVGVHVYYTYIYICYMQIYIHIKYLSFLHLSCPSLILFTKFEFPHRFLTRRESAGESDIKK